VDKKYLKADCWHQILVTLSLSKGRQVSKLYASTGSA